jgi:hypothetical protein
MSGVEHWLTDTINDSQIDGVRRELDADIIGQKP